MDLSPKLAFQNVLRHPARTVLTVGGIGLGVAVILAVSMLNSTSRRSMERMIEELGSGATDIWIEEASENTTTVGTRYEGFAESLVDELEGLAAVQSVHPSLRLYAMMRSAGRPEPHEAFLYGIRLTDDAVVRSHVLSEGHLPEAPDQVVVGAGLADALGLSTGSRLMLQSPLGTRTLTVSGLLDPLSGSGTLHHGRVAFADLAVVQEHYGYPGKITAANIVLESGADLAETAERVERRVPPNVEVMTDPLTVSTKGGDASRGGGILNSLYTGIALCIAMFIIYNTLVSTIEEQRREIGLLRLVGMTGGQVARLFLLQALIYGVIGSAAGAGLGIALGWGMVSMLQRAFPFHTFDLVMPSPQDVIQALVTGILVTLVVALFPSARTSRLSPMQAFRPEEESASRARRFTVGSAIGIVLLCGTVVVSLLDIPGPGFASMRFLLVVPLCVGLLLLLRVIVPAGLRLMSWIFGTVFGVPGMLAARSLHQRMKRTVATIGAIVVATALATAIMSNVVVMKQTTAAWLDDTRWADVLIFSASGAAMDTSVVDAVAGARGIREVNPIRYYFVSYEHERLSDNGFLFQAVDPETFKMFTGIDVPSGDSLIINAGLARMIGAEDGGRITLATARGETDFTVAGSIVDYTDFVHRLGKIVYGSYDNLVTYWGASGYSVLQVRLEEGFSQEAAKRELLAALSGTYDVKILTHDEEKSEVGSSIDRLFTTNYAITGILFLIVFMGMFNTVFINVLFQLREFAVLRSVGLLSRQVRWMTIWEAVVMGLIGSILAIVAGMWLGWQMMLGIREMIGILLAFYVPWILVATILALVVVIAVVATLYPQRVASQLSIAEIMRVGEGL
jgi:putative ABC transport system permease protein